MLLSPPLLLLLLLASASFVGGASTGGIKLDLPPGVTSVVIDIGAFDTPIEPSDPSQVVIAVEPLPDKCADILRKRLDNVILLCAAVADERGVALFHTYGTLGLESGGAHTGVASSLAPLAPGATEPEDEYTPRSPWGKLIVATVTLGDVIGLVPWNVTIALLKTDMQGFDFTALRSAGSALRRCSALKTECWAAGHATYTLPPHLGNTNSFDDDFVPYLSRMGFVLTKLEKAYVPVTGTKSEGAPKRAREFDSFWSRVEEPVDGAGYTYEYQTMNAAGETTTVRAYTVPRFALY